MQWAKDETVVCRFFYRLRTSCSVICWCTVVVVVVIFFSLSRDRYFIYSNTFCSKRNSTQAKTTMVNGTIYVELWGNMQLRISMDSASFFLFSRLILIVCEECLLCCAFSVFLLVPFISACVLLCECLLFFLFFFSLKMWRWTENITETL